MELFPQEIFILLMKNKWKIISFGINWTEIRMMWNCNKLRIIRVFSEQCNALFLTSRCTGKLRNSIWITSGRVALIGLGTIRFKSKQSKSNEHHLRMFLEDFRKIKDNYYFCNAYEDSNFQIFSRRIFLIFLLLFV